MKHEDVMVVDTALLVPFIERRPADLIRERTAEILELISEKHFFVARADAEVSPQWRQVIPYVVILHGDEVFTLQRTAKQTEARLHHKISIGIGGHVNPGHDLLAGLRKELDEEVEIDAPYSLEFAGILNDETTEVGRVHLGAVYLLHADGASVRVRETEKMIGSWLSRPELAKLHGAMESWSQIAFDALLRA